MLGILDQQFPTDTWLLLWAAKYREIERIVRRVQPDVLWCTGDPWSALVAARRIAERFDIPWVADFRDPWTLSEIRSKGMWRISRRADAYFERKIIESADLIMFQAGSVEEAYRQHYRDLEPKTQLILNSFDPNVFEDPIAFDDASAMPASVSDGLHLGFFGRFRAMSPATVIADALAVVRRRESASAGRIYVHSFGALNDADAEYASRLGVASSFIQESAVPLEQSLGVLRRFDLLLVSTDLSRDRIIPAKIYEYMAAGRPILSLSRNPEVKSILEETHTGIQMDPTDPEAVADFLLGCLSAADAGEPLPLPFAPTEEAMTRFEARETTRELARAFDEISAPRKQV